MRPQALRAGRQHGDDVAAEIAFEDVDLELTVPRADGLWRRPQTNREGSDFGTAISLLVKQTGVGPTSVGAPVPHESIARRLSCFVLGVEKLCGEEEQEGPLLLLEGWQYQKRRLPGADAKGGLNLALVGYGHAVSLAG